MPEGAVSIARDKLLVTDAAAFDFETNPTITGTVTATVGNVTDMAEFTITLTDVIEASTSEPDFPYTFTTDMDENGIAVMTITDYDVVLGGTDVDIPAYIEDQGTLYTVTAIGFSAFSRKGLTSVTLPNTVLSIEGRGFLDNRDLRMVDLGSGLEIIGDNAFNSCGLTSLNISDNVLQIGEFAFAGNNSLTSLDLGNGLTSIGKKVFTACGLTSINIPDNIKTIGEGAFLQNIHLSSVNLGAGLETIGINAFDRCGLESLTIPDNVKVIESLAFANNGKLTTINIGSGLMAINESVFQSCNLARLTIPNNITEIDNTSFSSNPITTVCADATQQALLNAQNLDNYGNFDTDPTTTYTFYTLADCPSDE